MRPAAADLLAEDIGRILSRTAALWPSLKRGRIVVTGATGFFGTWLLEILLAANREYGLGLTILALSRRPAGFIAKAAHLANDCSVRWVVGDVRDFDFPQGDITHIIHAATESASNLNASNPGEMFEVCTAGTNRVLALAYEKRVDRMLFTSSGAVYGRQPPGLSHIPEDYAGGPDPLDRRNAYAEGKRAAEFLCGLAATDPAHPVPVTVARCFAFVGPHLPLDRHFAIGNFIRDALGGGPIRIAGDGTPFRSYLYAADLAEWLITILLRGKSGRAYNVGSEEPVSIRELAIRVARVADLPETAVTVAKAAPAGVAADRYVPSCRRACDDLHLTPATSLDEAIRRTLEFHRHHASG